MYPSPPSPPPSSGEGNYWRGSGRDFPEGGGERVFSDNFWHFKWTVPRDFRLKVFFMNPLCRWDWRQICNQYRWHRWCTLTCEYLREFSKKFEMALMLFSGAWGRWFMKKTWSKKSLDNVPLKNQNFVSNLFVFPRDILYRSVFNIFDIM